VTHTSDVTIGVIALDGVKRSAARPLASYTRARTLEEGWDGTHDRLFRLKHGLPCVAVCVRVIRNGSVVKASRLQPDRLFRLKRELQCVRVV
jgi:hypothetical protein